VLWSDSPASASKYRFLAYRYYLSERFWEANLSSLILLTLNASPFLMFLLEETYMKIPTGTRKGILQDSLCVTLEIDLVRTMYTYTLKRPEKLCNLLFFEGIHGPAKSSHIRRYCDEGGECDRANGVAGRLAQCSNCTVSSVFSEVKSTVGIEDRRSLMTCLATGSKHCVGSLKSRR
jgi:hypothetical protein